MKNPAKYEMDTRGGLDAGATPDEVDSSMGNVEVGAVPQGILL